MIDQLIIAFAGPLSIWMVNDDRPRVARWGSVVALLSQPAWLYAAIVAQQWGIFWVEFMFIYGWYKGYRSHWPTTSLCLKALPHDIADCYRHCRLVSTHLLDKLRVI